MSKKQRAFYNSMRGINNRKPQGQKTKTSSGFNEFSLEKLVEEYVLIREKKSHLPAIIRKQIIDFFENHTYSSCDGGLLPPLEPEKESLLIAGE